MIKQSIIDLRIIDDRIGIEFPFSGRQTPGSAGVDLQACIQDEITLRPDETEMIGTGIAIHIGDPGYAAIILPRSGLGAKHGIVLGNLVGLIDSDYQGEIKVCLWNRSRQDFVVRPGDRIAQMVVIPVAQFVFRVVDAFEKSIRGVSGFGSTGK